MTDRDRAIAERVRRLRQELPPHVRIVAVTKYADLPDILAARAAGISEIGENRVQEARRKYEQLNAVTGCEDRQPPFTWHLVGHLQTNKVRQAVNLFSVIHSVDSVRLAELVAREAGRLGKKQEVFMQVDTSGDPAKHGFAPADAEQAWPALQALPHMRITGLMTIAPAAGSESAIRSCFRGLRLLRDRLAGSPGALPWLSMGMTDDYRLAVEEGANIVRIGRLIFA